MEASTFTHPFPFAPEGITDFTQPSMRDDETRDGTNCYASAWDKFDLVHLKILTGTGHKKSKFFVAMAGTGHHPYHLFSLLHICNDLNQLKKSESESLPFLSDTSGSLPTLSLGSAETLLIADLGLAFADERALGDATLTVGADDLSLTPNPVTSLSSSLSDEEETS